jgi:hypothetical protein
VLFTCFYTVPVNLINNMVLSPGLWSRALTKLNITTPPGTVQKFLSTLSGLSQSLIFSICAPIFKFLADAEGSSSSMAKAEQKAMIFFWYFYIVARFLGQILMEGILQFLKGGKYILHFFSVGVDTFLPIYFSIAINNRWDSGSNSSIKTK